MKTCTRCRIGDCPCLRELNEGPMVDGGQLPALSDKGGTQPVGDVGATPAPPPSPDLIKAMAEAVGKNLAAYVEVMYPEAMRAASSTFKVSLRNHVYNDIMRVSTLHTEAEILAWLASNEAHRKEWLALYRNLRRKKS